MKKPALKSPTPIRAKMIAPCGMNCGVCIGHLREKNRCAGCLAAGADKVKHCAVCRIRNCGEAGNPKSGSCIRCAKFPCLLIRHLDKRYRTRYGMSMIENLENIREIGLREFVVREKVRWRCPHCGGILSVHRPNCISCGQVKLMAFPLPRRINPDGRLATHRVARCETRSKG
jgi:hypothetical protein